MNEESVTMEGYEKYLIFKSGKVWSKTKNIFMNPSITKDGYLQTMFNRKSEKIHRVIAKAFLANPENKREVNHIDGNKLNNNVNNLEWCDRSYNIKHAHSLNLISSKRENNGNAKLTEKDVAEIRTIGKYMFQKDIAVMYKVSQTQIGYILNYKSW